ncbi:hypothetical protein DY000_02043563 [Brassica cretica]|uniref:Transcription initiation factor TFIID subunit 12 domain-containing protein n=1 Tax=Brassica cretica TaxID=69181 RepID=A0ABQ7BM56_BRACR|nr:hypothetical protein DY000_02043563 [Brassica cretica]
MDQPRKTRAVGEASKPENLSQIQQPPSTNPSSSIPSSPTPPAPSLSPNPSPPQYTRPVTSPATQQQQHIPHSLARPPPPSYSRPWHRTLTSPQHRRHCYLPHQPRHPLRRLRLLLDRNEIGARLMQGSQGVGMMGSIGSIRPSGMGQHQQRPTQSSLSPASSPKLSRAYSLMRPSSIDSPGAAQQSLQAINQPWLSSSGQGNQAKTVSSENEVSDNRIHELLQQIDPSEKLDPEVAAILADIAEDFVESQLLAVLKPSIETTTFNLGLVSLFLKCRKNWNIRPPGFSSDEIKTFRKPLTTDIHKERLAAIKKSVTVTEAANARNPYRHGTANARGGQAKTPAKSLGLHNF